MANIPLSKMLEDVTKATFTAGGDLGGAGQAPLALEQVDEFLRIAITPTEMLSDVRRVQSTSPVWEESQLDFNARVLRPGTEAVRLLDADRVSPGTGLTQITTNLFRAEVPISDEALEDTTERAGFGDSVMTMMAEAVGRDVEEFMINGDTGSGDAFLAVDNGWLVLAQGAGSNIVDVTADLQDYRTIFARMLQTLPQRFKRAKPDMRFYVPTILHEKYIDQIAERGTALGDSLIEGTRALRYQGVSILPVANFPVVAGTPDTSNILLSNKNNLYFGVQRDIRMETWRDPREGATSFVATTRIDAEIAVVESTVIATNVNIEP